MAIALCKRLRLSIDLEDTNEGGEQLRLTLTDDRTLEEVALTYEVGSGTANKKYHRREAMIISMRRLIGEAIQAGLMTDSRYESSGLPQRVRRRD